MEGETVDIDIEAFIAKVDLKTEIGIVALAHYVNTELVVPLLRELAGRTPVVGRGILFEGLATGLIGCMVAECGYPFSIGAAERLVEFLKNMKVDPLLGDQPVRES